MRALILSTLLACVAAAPSILAPYPYSLPFAYSGVQPLLVAPTIPPGDIAAAAIDAQVKFADNAQFHLDQAQNAADQIVESQNQGLLRANDLAKEKAEEALWATEEQKWQALNQAQIAEANFAGEIASKVALEAEATEVKSEPTEVKAEVKSEEKAEIKETEMKTEEKLEDKAAEIEKPVEAEMPKTEESDVIKTVTAETKKLQEALEALKTGIASFNYVSPFAYPTYSYQTAFPMLPYHPAVAVKHVW